MLKRIIYVSALCLIISILFTACGTGGTQNGDESSFDNNTIYAPTDTTEGNGQGENPTDEPEDTSDAIMTEPSDTMDVTDTDDAADTTEAVTDSEPDETDTDADAEDHQPEETETSDVTPDEPYVIVFNEDFLTGEHAVGSIVSRQSEKIRLIISYDCAVEVDGSVTVAFEVGLECYDINCGSRTNGGKIFVNGDVYTFSTDAIVHEGTGMIYIPFETYMCQLDAGETSCTIGASWFFNGVYAGAQIDTLTVDATLDWSANN